MGIGSAIPQGGGGTSGIETGTDAQGWVYRKYPGGIYEAHRIISLSSGTGSASGTINGLIVYTVAMPSMPTGITNTHATVEIISSSLGSIWIARQAENQFVAMRSATVTTAVTLMVKVTVTGTW